MPKNTVSDPITDQEMAFAHLVLSGTMNDRRAAEAVGLNPDSAAYTKAKPRVYAYMIEHRAAVEEKLVDQEAEGLRKLNLGRDQILTRLWELANLSPEMTRGSIAGQVKALSMIVAIEGLIPDRRLSPSGKHPVAPPVAPQIYTAQWRRQPQHQTASDTPGDTLAATDAQPAAPQAPEPEPPPNPEPKPDNNTPPPPLERNFERNFEQNFERNSDRSFDDHHPCLETRLLTPDEMNLAPAATSNVFEAVLDTTKPLRLSLSTRTGPLNRRR
jgi:hypothetical protein